MTDTVRVPRTTVVRLLAVVPKGSGLAVHLAAMLAASPQGEGSSADTHPPQPDALPGDLREKVAAVLYENIGAAAWSGDAEVHGIPEAADAILSLIQSERGGA